MVYFCKRSRKFLDAVSKNTSVTIVQSGQPVAQQPVLNTATTQQQSLYADNITMPIAPM